MKAPRLWARGCHTYMLVVSEPVWIWLIVHVVIVRGLVKVEILVPVEVDLTESAHGEVISERNKVQFHSASAEDAGVLEHDLCHEESMH